MIDPLLEKGDRVVIRHSIKLAACISIFGVAVLSNNAMAMNKQACEQLPGNMFLAAVERGECDINIQTAAGPKDEPILEEDGGGDRGRPNRDGRSDGRNGGGESGEGGNGGRGGSTRSGRI